jgi:YfiH family protein
MQYGISTKTYGQMKLMEGILVPEVAANRATFLAQYKLHSELVVSAALVHGNHVEMASIKDAGKIFPATDGLVTNESGLVLTVTVADCVPLFFHDATTPAIGIAHAGWRGVLSQIAPETIKTMTTGYGSKPENITVHIGPHLGSCHFEVQHDVIDKFAAYPAHILTRADKTYIDLVGVLQDQLLAAGIQAAHLTASTECTYDFPTKYFSFRRDKPEVVQSMLAFISL